MLETRARYVVTGAGGFIGQHFVPFARAAGRTVVGVGRSPGPWADEVIDLSQPGALDRLLDAETTIVHLAGSADLRSSVSDPMADFEANVLASLRVLDSARAAGARVVFASTGSIYDADATLPFAETAPVRPRSPYAAAKLAVEAYCQAYHSSYGLDVVVARIFSAFGPGMKRFAIRDFFQRLERDPHSLVLWGDGLQVRDYLYVDDAVRALHLVAEKGASGETYNLGSGEGRTIRAVAETVVAAMGIRNCKISTDGRNFAPEAYRLEADVGKLRKLGFRPTVPFEEGVARTVAWLRGERAASRAEL